VTFKSQKIQSEFENQEMANDKEIVSKHVREYINEIMEHLLSLLCKEDREEFFNSMAKQFNIKVANINTKK
jgi:cell division protein ZapA (FtsZ GTPase activity inhibitor)